jgi:rhomboid protease GluP
MISEDHLEFLHAVWTRRPLFTYIFFGVNIFIFGLMALAGGSDPQTLIAFGVKDNGLIASGQWWRFVTPVFIHIGLLHLAFNSYALWIIGPQVEKLYGPARFVILYVLTGIAGVCGSYFYHPEARSAGASGAIFGLFGVLLVFGIRYRRSIPPEFKRAVGTGVVPVIAINLFIGFTIPGIDNSAHIGGLLIGAALAALVPFQKPGDETSGGLKAVQILLIALIVTSFYAVAQNYNGPRLSVRNVGRGFSLMPGVGSASDEFKNAVNDAQNTFDLSADILTSGRTNQLAPLKRDTAKSIDQLRKLPPLDPKADELAAALLRVMQQEYELIESVERSGVVNFGHNLQLKENVRAYRDVVEEISRWVETNGAQYGIENRKNR